jgi:hypothetical protein
MVCQEGGAGNDGGPEKTTADRGPMTAKGRVRDRDSCSGGKRPPTEDGGCS